MNFDDLEFSISQYLDGTLSADEAAALEARLETDEAARRVLEEYRELDAALKKPALPEVRWERLAEHLSMTVAGEAERVEFVAMEFVDGSLVGEEKAAFEAQLRDDDRAQKLVEQHGRLVDGLRSLPRPAVRWEKLTAHLYATAVGEQRSYKMDAYRWIRVTGGLAVAACVLMVTAVGLRSHLGQPTTPTAKVAGPTVALIQIGGMDDVETKASRPVVAEVSIGAGTGQPDAGGTEFADGIIVDSSPRSLIATNGPVAQDVQMPY